MNFYAKLMSNFAKIVFRLPAVLRFGSDSNGSELSKKKPVPVPFRFLKMTSELSVPRFRLEPTQLYYMKKLDCSLPWLQNYSGSLRKCGSNDSIDRLIETMKNLDENENEIDRMGCNKPNCKSTKWNVVKSEALEASSKNAGEIGFKISYSTKVNNI